MAALDGVFDARTVEPNAGLKPVPVGKYKAIIRKSEKKANSAKTGHYIEMVFEIVEGDSRGKRVYARLNLWNPNNTAVEIARGELSAICHATGVMNLSDTQQLHNIPLMIKVSVKERNDKKGEYTNEIDGYERTDVAAHNSQATYVAAKSADDVAPWETN